MKMINNEKRIKELTALLEGYQNQLETLDKKEQVKLLNEMKKARVELDLLLEMKEAIDGAEELDLYIEEFKLVVKDGYYIHEKIFFLIEDGEVVYYELKTAELSKESLEKIQENPKNIEECEEAREGKLTVVKNGLVFDDKFLFLVLNGSVEIYRLSKKEG